MKIYYAEKGAVVNTIRDCPAEHAYIDELEGDDLYPDPVGYDMTDPNDKARYEHQCRLAVKYVNICICEKLRRKNMPDDGVFNIWMKYLDITYVHRYF